MASYFSCSIGEEQQFRVALNNGGMTSELVRQVGNNAELGRIMVAALQAELAKQKWSEVVYDIPLHCSFIELITTGKYDWVSDSITQKNFPIVQSDDASEDIKVVLVHPDRALCTEEVKAELDRRGLKPATLTELLMFGAVYPELQRAFPVIALGSSWYDPNRYRHVPALWADRLGRHLGLLCDDPDDRWSARNRFIAVRKEEGEKTSS